MGKDLFSTQADVYARYRPTYPAELYDYIFSFVSGFDQAWDCATGNGQAALALSTRFRQVMATDHSQQQLDQATPRPNISYLRCKAEQSPFAENSFSLVTVAQSYHWFDFPAFQKEVERVLKPGGVLAIWGYNIPQGDDEKLNECIRYFYREVAGPYWDPERKYIDEAYSTVGFDYHNELPSRNFYIQVEWDAEDLLGYFSTWSSVQHYLKDRGTDPVEAYRKTVLDHWPSPGKISLRFPVFLRLARIGKPANKAL